MGEYLIKKGDNLINIAKANGTTVNMLLKYNPKLQKNKNLIFAGDKIQLPPKSAEDIDMTVPGMSIETTKPTNVQKPKKATQTTRTQNTNPPARTPEPPKVIDTKTNKENQRVHDLAMVAYIIDDDKAKHQIDTLKMSNRIVAAANYAGIKPENLAAIVKQESHFSPQIIISSNGKGPTGITSICPKDLYERPQVFDRELGEILKNYNGSLKKLFNAKRENPNLYIGNLGEILYKYKNNTNLYNAVQKDFDLNLKVGAYNYKMALYENKGNERAAFRRYNASSRRVKYANDTMNTVNKARSASSFTLNNTLIKATTPPDTHQA